MDKETKKYEDALAAIGEREQKHIAACDDCDARADEIHAQLENVTDSKEFDKLHEKLADIAEEKQGHQDACQQCAQDMSDAAPPMFYGLEPVPEMTKRQKHRLQEAVQKSARTKS